MVSKRSYKASYILSQGSEFQPVPFVLRVVFDLFDLLLMALNAVPFISMILHISIVNKVHFRVLQFGTSNV